jgi:hypothetical protein
VRTPVRLAVVAAGLGAVFAAAVGVGAAVGPWARPRHTRRGRTGDRAEAAQAPVYVLDVLEERPAAGDDDRGVPRPRVRRRPVTRYTPDHGEDLHLVAVRADLSGYQHVHPDLGADGTWRTPLTLTPGSWHLVADTTPAAAGEDLALTADLQVAGTYDPPAAARARLVAEVDGYTVVLSGELAPGSESELTFSVQPRRQAGG